MDSQKLRELLGQNEGLKLEFKKILHIVDLPDSNIHKDRYRDEFVRDVLALINGNSGTANQMAYLIIGAENTLESDGTRELHDCNHITLTNKQILDKLKRFCHPPIPDLECERIDIDGKMIFVISIPPSPNVHETACDLVMPNPKKTSYPAYTTFIRRNEEIAQASIAELDAIRQEKKAWNSQISTQDNIAIDWQKVCYEMLARQKSAWQLRKKATEIGAEADVYVPLDLLEQKEKPRKNTSENAGNEKRDIDDLSKEVTKTYAHDEFLQGLTERQSKNKHIAIAGEAGAGKTTLLATIAKLLCSNGHSPIFISLADLQGESLEDYLVDHWLSQALGKRTGRTPEEIKDNFIEQLKVGNFWLLLDGLDEMGAKSPSEALGRIDREIREIIGQSRVVLTCRLNVWDAKLNNLPNFDTFRMGYFDPEQIDEFIRDWFLKAEKPELGAVLQAKLKEPNRDRIRDMVRHPLRLALLCQAFYRNPNEDLPETKAGLYDLFVRYFYEWKPNFVPEDMQTHDGLREKLHEALGNLAREGIDDSSIGFRFLRNFAVKEMGNRLFKLACDLGWLNLVERNEQDQEVYAFFHPTFQEYFAALAISDSYFFLHHISEDPYRGTYRIFEPQWEEVFLLWLGQRDKNLIESAIKQLLSCADLCEKVYAYKLLFILALGTAEMGEVKDAAFSNYIDVSDGSESLEDALLKLTIGFAFPDFEQNPNLFKDPVYKDLVKSNAKEVLKRIAQNKVANKLIGLLSETFIEGKSSQICDVVEFLLQILSSVDSSSKVLIEQERDKIIYSLIDSSLGGKNHVDKIRRIGAGSSRAINKLIELMNNSSEAVDKLSISGNLLYLDPNNQEAVEVLFSIIRDSKSIHTEAVNLFAEITPKNSWLHCSLVNLLSTRSERHIIELVDGGLDYVTNHPNSEIENILIDLLRSNNEDVRRSAARNLLNVTPDDPQAIQVLNELAVNSLDSEVRRKSAYRLLKIDPSNSKALDVLVELLTDLNVESRKLTAEYIWEFGNCCPKVIDALSQLIYEDNEARCIAAISLGKIGARYPNNLKASKAYGKAIKSLLEMLREGKNCWQIAYAFPEILLRSSNLCHQATITTLKEILESSPNNECADACHRVLWQCAESMSYRDFYHSWHPVSNVDALQGLEDQFVDCDSVQKELDRTNDRPEEIRCIVVDIRKLEQESDLNAIAEEIGIRIFDSLGFEIPEIRRVSNLKRELSNLKHKLGVEKLSIALYCREENPIIGKLCHDLDPI